MRLQNTQNSIVLAGFQRVKRHILRVRVLHLRFIEQIGVHAVQKRQHDLLTVYLASIKHRLHLCARVKIEAAFDVSIKRQKCAVCHTLLHIREKRGRTSRVRGVRRQNKRVGPAAGFDLGTNFFYLCFALGSIARQRDKLHRALAVEVFVNLRDWIILEEIFAFH